MDKLQNIRITNDEERICLTFFFENELAFSQQFSVYDSIEETETNLHNLTDILDEYTNKEKHAEEQDHLRKYYSDRDNCFKDLCLVRKLFSTRTTEAQAKQGYKTLQIMYLYCPEEIQETVQVTIDEYEFRMGVMNLNYHYEEGITE